MELGYQVKKIRDMLFQRRFPEMMNQVYALLSSLAGVRDVDRNHLNTLMTMIIDALNHKDYLLAVDILTYEILPMYQTEGKPNEYSRGE